MLVCSLVPLILAVPVLVLGLCALDLARATPPLHHHAPLYLTDLPGLLIVKLVKFVKNDLLLADVKCDGLDLLSHIGKFGGALLEPREKGGHTIVCRLMRPRHISFALDTRLGDEDTGVFMGSDVKPCGLKSAAYPTAIHRSSLASVEMLDHQGLLHFR
jgi:hypothetical protein